MMPVKSRVFSGTLRREEHADVDLDSPQTLLFEPLQATSERDELNQALSPNEE